MSKELSNSEKMEEIVDKIFLLNHKIVSGMISSSQNEELKQYPKLNEELETKWFEKLAEYYEELRIVIREALTIADEINLAEMSGLSKKTQEELKIQSREEYKDKIIEAIEARIKTMFISMNFAPSGTTIEGEEVSTSSIYDGKPEEFVRAQEYSSLMESISKQMEIIYFEEEFSKKSTSPESTISPYIVPPLLDTIGDRAAYAKAEEDCEKYLEQSNKQAEVYDEFPELRYTAEQVEFLRLQNRYKKRFEDAAGYLNSKTTYGKYFFNLYKAGMLPLLTGFNNDEIASRVTTRVEDYSNQNKNIIQEMFNFSVKKFKKFRIKRNIDEKTEFIKYKLSNLSKLPKKIFETQKKKIAENAVATTAKKKSQKQGSKVKKENDNSSKKTQKNRSKNENEK